MELMIMKMLFRIQTTVVFTVLFALQSLAEDGSRLWLRYEPLPENVATAYMASIRSIVTLEKSPTVEIAQKEFQTAFEVMTGQVLKVSRKPKKRTAFLHLFVDRNMKDDYSIDTKEDKSIEIASPDDVGILYGVFHLLRLMQTGADISALNIHEKASCEYRLLNHWDFADGRSFGQAGNSIWKWNELPDTVSPRYVEYARANASVGINGAVLNHHNAQTEFLTPEMLAKVKVLAGIFRPYGIKVYLSVKFSSPQILGGLKTSDPADKDVQQWWKDKANEIYRFIPDFGGFQIKANSEGQPGPQDYGRTHADGANILADALKPHGGIVMWRAFVYAPSSDDRAKQAYIEFAHLDGLFRDNVILQVKNGPVDFQPREAFNPLFGAMKKTPLMPELQILQEYLGRSNHLVFLASMWREFFDSDTYCKGAGSTVSKVVDGIVYGAKLTGITGCANIGDDANWCGHHFAQANWYAFGRLAWNNRLTPGEIAGEWLRMTFTTDTAFVNPVGNVMNNSWETCVSYMTPLGQHHIFALRNHYEPQPWCNIPNVRADFLAPYYHRADSTGLGFNRTTTGSNAVSQYHSPLREEWNRMETCPENFLTWFHHVPWDYTTKSGRTFWNELCFRYGSGVKNVFEFQKIWNGQESRVDTERFRQIQSRLRIQARDAVWWKDACLQYFCRFSQRPIPEDIETLTWRDAY
jgi:alpha-glucuronidase